MSIRSSANITQQPLQFNNAHRKWWDDISKNTNVHSHNTINTTPYIMPNINKNIYTSVPNVFSVENDNNLSDFTNNQLTNQTNNIYNPFNNLIYHKESQQIPQQIYHSHQNAPTYQPQVSRPPIYKPPTNYYNNNSYNIPAQPTMQPLSQNYLTQVQSQAPTTGCGCSK
jgi:hypothetical protein